MLQELRTPGVHIRSVTAIAVPRLRLGVTGFVGLAERGPVGYPQGIDSWQEFQAVFGGFLGFSYLAPAVFGFFANGGERCIVVRVAHESAASSSAVFFDGAGQAVVEAVALNPGIWGDLLDVRVRRHSTDEIALTRLTRDEAGGSSIVNVSSVAGIDPGDRVTLVNPKESFRRHTADVLAAIASPPALVLTAPLPRGFPEGSDVRGRGFQITVSDAASAGTDPLEVQRFRPAPRREVFDNLSLDEDHPRYFVRAINGEPDTDDPIARGRAGRSALVRVVDRGATLAGGPGRPVSAVQPLQNGADGNPDVDFRYYTGRVGADYVRPIPPGSDEATRRLIGERLFGLAALEPVAEVGAVTIPDLVLPDLHALRPAAVPAAAIVSSTVRPSTLDEVPNLRAGQTEMLTHCERLRDRMAILDAPPGARLSDDLVLDVSPAGVQVAGVPIDTWPDGLQTPPASRYGALYHPWVRPAALVGAPFVFVPPSGHVAGVYARVERERSAGFPPANEALRGVVELEAVVSERDQEVLNPRGVNCLRPFGSRGLRIWGARTLSPEAAFRYVNVRRVTLALIKVIAAGLQWTTFEPHGPRLRAAIVTALTALMQEQFRSGVLAGLTPAEAFRVTCDESINPPDRVDLGELVAEIRFAPVNPGEFIVVTVRRTAASLVVTEGGA